MSQENELYFDAAGGVYFTKESGTNFLKIGCVFYEGRRADRKLRIRIRYLNVGNPRKLLLLAYFPCDYPSKVEKELHNKFQHLKVRGEWFRYEGSLKKEIEKIRKKFPLKEVGLLKGIVK